jgi:bifunctional ADP-heptose synthase (sugar kinase/adenylyltransferase)
VTPNRKEAEQASGASSRRSRTARGRRRPDALADLDAAVITLGADGIYFRTKRGEPARVPRRRAPVFDVTGAGDTVIAQLAFHVAEASARAGGRAREPRRGDRRRRLGTHAVTRSELLARPA